MVAKLNSQADIRIVSLAFIICSHRIAASEMESVPS